MSIIMTDRGWVQLGAGKCGNSNDLQGVYRPQSWKMMRVILEARANKYCKALEGWVEGNDFGTQDMGQRWQAMWREGGSSDPIEGAFGERL